MPGSNKTALLDHPCKPNPDVAGLGVIISFVVSAVLTVALSIACAILKYFYLRLEDTKSTSRLIAQSSGYAKLRLLIRTRLSSTKDKSGRQKSLLLWHELLGGVVRGLGLNQLITGFALYVCTLATYGIDSNDPHSDLGCTLSILSVVSQELVFHYRITPALASRSIELRRFLVLACGTGVTITQIYRSCRPKAVKVGGWLFVLDCYLLCVILNASPEKTRKREPELYGMTLAVSFLITLGLTSYLIAYTLQLKLGANEGCDLNTPAENQWTLGQVFTVVMLLGLLLPAEEAYLDLRDEEQEDGADEVELVSPNATNDPVEPACPVIANYDSYWNTLPVPDSSLIPSQRVSQDLTDAHRNEAETHEYAASFSTADDRATAVAGTSSALENLEDEGFAPPSRRNTSGLESQD